MIALVALVLFAVVPALIAITLDVRSRRAAARFRAALAAEREETRRRYMDEEDVTERRQSFSAWPWEHR